MENESTDLNEKEKEKEKEKRQRKRKRTDGKLKKENFESNKNVKRRKLNSSLIQCKESGCEKEKEREKENEMKCGIGKEIGKECVRKKKKNPKKTKKSNLSIFTDMRIDISNRIFISEDCDIFGDGNTIFGNKNKIYGNDNTIFGDDNVIRGWRTKVDGVKNHVQGDETVFFNSQDKNTVTSEMDILIGMVENLRISEPSLFCKEVSVNKDFFTPKKMCVESTCPEIECVVCRDHKINTMMLDCSHCCMCTCCAIRIINNPDPSQRRCPLCKVEIVSGIDDLIITDTKTFLMNRGCKV
jgi:hypothetical protein